MSLWSFKDIMKAVGGECSASEEDNWGAKGLSIDSRTLNAGDVFIALQGDDKDGHDYVEEAITKGALAAIVSRSDLGVDPQKLIVVPDTMKALEGLARAARARTGATIIGVTGTVGKTTTKEMLATAFSSLGQTHASQKSYNNHWGVPYSLATLHAGCDAGIFEMGMNHAGEIEVLTQQVKPQIAIITTVTEVHMGFFDDGLDGVARAKSEIFTGVEKGGSVILNKDNAYYDFLSKKAKEEGVAHIYGFGESSNADAYIVECIEAANGSRAKLKILDEDVTLSLQIAGRHFVHNALATLLAVKVAGEDIQKAAKALERQEAVPGRGAREYLDIGESANPVTLIDESYNASPAAMKAAFKVLALIDPGRGGRRIAVLGDMLELGDQSPKLHADLAFPLQAADVNLVYTCGPLMKNLHDSLPEGKKGTHKENSRSLAQIVPDVLVPGDVVMVKGSLGSKMGTVVEALRALPDKLKKKKVRESH